MVGLRDGQESSMGKAQLVWQQVRWTVTGLVNCTWRAIRMQVWILFMPNGKLLKGMRFGKL